MPKFAYVVKRGQAVLAGFQTEAEAVEYASTDARLRVVPLCACGNELGDGMVEQRLGKLVTRYCSFQCPLAPARAVYPSGWSWPHPAVPLRPLAPWTINTTTSSRRTDANPYRVYANSNAAPALIGSSIFDMSEGGTR